MGLFDLFMPQHSVPTITSILPNAAKQEILSGRLPILKTNKIFLKQGETCHFIDRGIYEKKTVSKRYVRRNTGYSMPGLFKRTRIYRDKGLTDIVNNTKYETIRGILYITNKRIIFVGENEGFDRKIIDLVAITPYENCIVFQFSKENYKVFIPNGNITYTVLQQLN